MMKLTIRQFKLLQYISNFPGLMLNDYSKALNISVPTLKTEFKHMENLLQKYHVMIEISGKNNLQVWGKENLTHLLIDSRYFLEFSLENQIILLLLLTDDFVVLQDIADKLFISKSKIEKSMPDILKKYPNDFQSLRHYGIRCITPEAEKRALFAKLLMTYFKGIDLLQEADDFHTMHFPIFDYMNRDSAVAANEIIAILQHNREFTFTDESVCQLFLCFMLMINNYKSENPRIVSDIFVNVISDLPNSMMYLKSASEIARIIGVSDSNNEICYISYMLMSLRKQNVFDIKAIVAQMRDVILEISLTIVSLNWEICWDFDCTDKEISDNRLISFCITLAPSPISREPSFILPVIT